MLTPIEITTSLVSLLANRHPASGMISLLDVYLGLPGADVNLPTAEGIRPLWANLGYAHQVNSLLVDRRLFAAGARADLAFTHDDGTVHVGIQTLFDDLMTHASNLLDFDLAVCLARVAAWFEAGADWRAISHQGDLVDAWAATTTRLASQRSPNPTWTAHAQALARDLATQLTAQGVPDERWLTSAVAQAPLGPEVAAAARARILQSQPVATTRPRFRS